MGVKPHAGHLSPTHPEAWLSSWGSEPPTEGSPKGPWCPPFWHVLDMQGGPCPTAVAMFLKSNTPAERGPDTHMSSTSSRWLGSPRKQEARTPSTRKVQ